jgi:hypothetical protein
VAKNIKLLMRILLKNKQYFSSLIRKIPFAVAAEMMHQPNFPKDSFEFFFKNIMDAENATDKFKLAFVRRLATAGYGPQLRAMMEQYVKANNKNAASIIQKVIG